MNRRLCVVFAALVAAVLLTSEQRRDRDAHAQDALAEAPTRTAVYLHEAWLRVTVPAGWEPTDTPRMLPFQSRQAFAVRAVAGGEERGTFTVIHMHSDGTSLGNVVADLTVTLEQRNAAPVRQDDREINGQTYAQIKTTGPDWHVLAAVNRPAAVVIVHDVSGIDNEGAVQARQKWLGQHLRWFAPRPGFRAIAPLAGDVGHVLVPDGHEFTPDDDAAQPLRGLRLSQTVGPNTIAWRVDAMPVASDVQTLDDALAPFERGLADTLGYTREDGESGASVGDGFLSIGRLADGERLAAWYRLLAAHERLLVMVVRAPAAAPAGWLDPLRACIAEVMVEPIARAPLPDGLSLELSGEWLDKTGDAQADHARFGARIQDAQGETITFENVPYRVTARLLLAEVEDTSIVVDLRMTNSSDLLLWTPSSALEVDEQRMILMDAEVARRKALQKLTLEVKLTFLDAEAKLGSPTIIGQALLSDLLELGG